MYEPDTILKLKEPRSTEDTPFAYDQVKVLGQSPINYAKTSEWAGAAAQGVIIAPLTEFDRTLEEPYGKLQALYVVESIPTHEAPAAVPVKVINSTSGSAGPTPEEQFAETAPGIPPEPGQRRGRTSRAEQPSPLDAPVPSESPLGEVPGDSPEKE